MDFYEKTLKENVIFEGKIITLHVDDIELPDGSTSFREIVEHSGGVCVAALTDDMKLKSSMTLFHCVSGNKLFQRVLEKFFDGELDEKTVLILEELGGVHYDD